MCFTKQKLTKIITDKITENTERVVTMCSFSSFLCDISLLSFRPLWTWSETWFWKFWTRTRRTGSLRRPVQALQDRTPLTAHSCRGRPSWPTSPTRVCLLATPWTRPSSSSRRWSRIRALGSSRVGRRHSAMTLPLGLQRPLSAGSRASCTSLDFSVFHSRILGPKKCLCSMCIVLTKVFSPKCSFLFRFFHCSSFCT